MTRSDVYQSVTDRIILIEKDRVEIDKFMTANQENQHNWYY